MKRYIFSIMLCIALQLLGAMPAPQKPAAQLSNMQKMISYQKVKIEHERFIPNHIIKALTIDDVAVLKKYLTHEGGKLDVVDKQGRSMLMLAANNRCVNCVKELISRKANVNAIDAKGGNAAKSAASKGDLPILKDLVAAGANIKKIDKHGNTLLHWVAYGEASVPVARYLIEQGVWAHVKNTVGRTAADIAQERNAKKLLEYLNSVAPVLPPDVIDAVSFGNLPRIIDYLETGGPINAVSYTQSPMTLLMLAAFEGHLAIVLELLKRGVDVNKKDVAERRAIDFAQMHCCYPEVVAALKRAQDQAQHRESAAAPAAQNRMDIKHGHEPLDANAQEEERATAASTSKSVSPVHISPVPPSEGDSDE